MRTACLLAVVLAGTACHAADRIIYCDPQAAGHGAGDGTSWENACWCLQSALALATPGSEIRVAQGIYPPDVKALTGQNGAPLNAVPSGRREESFEIPVGVTLKGGYAGYGASNPDERDIDAYATILSGDLAGNDVEPMNFEWQGISDYVNDPNLTDNSFHVVTIVADSAQPRGEAVLDGLTITGGFADGGTLVPPNLSQTPALERQKDGAGALIVNVSPTFINCTFYRNVVYGRPQRAAGGGGAVACTGENDQTTFRGCTFQENIVFGAGAAAYGAGVLVEGTGVYLVDCVFTSNILASQSTVGGGGALATFRGRPALTGCRFEGNLALRLKGGAFFDSEPVGTNAFENCTFADNAADAGGAVYLDGRMDCLFRGCLFVHNRTANGGNGGAILQHDAGVTISRCRFVGNSAAGRGGAINADNILDHHKVTSAADSLFTGNSARRGGALFCTPGAEFELHNCTMSANRVSEMGAAVYGMRRQSNISNSIFWGDRPDELYLVEIGTGIRVSDVEGYTATLSDTGTIDADPQFRDAFGPDGIAGTLDDDLRLCLGSPCIDGGDDDSLDEKETDLDGNPRINGYRRDMGAYEFHGPYYFYVDAAHGSDSNGGGSLQRAFATIQKGIDEAQPGYTVMVVPGLYTQGIDFKGKAITVSGLNGAPTLEAPGDYGVSFYSAEGPESMLRNFVIRNCEVGVFAAGSSPTVRNVTLSRNGFGIAAYAGAHPTITNCILWENAKGDLFGCAATYSCVQDASEGLGNISGDPLFADPTNGDFHVLSAYGRFVPAYGLWSLDDRTSPCIDAGDPAMNVSAERQPNGGRINLGAFGGTPEASLSKCPCPSAGDVNEIPGAVAYGNPPEPNPAQWDPNDGLPAERLGGPSPLVDCYVEMRAAPAASPFGPVQYFFECDQAGFSSGWQEAHAYMVRVGRTGQGLKFRVRTRDRYGNTTGWSSWEEAIPLTKGQTSIPVGGS